MRLIDADALGIGKAKRDVFNNPAYADGWNSAIEIINNATTIDARPAWISVKHILPHAGQEVIAYSGNKMKPSVFATTFYAKTWAAWHTITHWMPLPEPPNCDADVRGEEDAV